MPKGVYKRTKPAWNKGKTGYLSAESRYKMGSPWRNKKRSLRAKKAISRKLKGKYIREKSSNWKGGQYKTKYGYVYVINPTHPLANDLGYVNRSIIVMEKKLKRILKPQEIVHHINGIKDDDRIKNLQLFSSAKEHMKYHHPKGSIWGINITHLKKRLNANNKRNS